MPNKSVMVLFPEARRKSLVGTLLLQAQVLLNLEPVDISHQLERET